jgi:serine/threonine protein kinase
VKLENVLCDTAVCPPSVKLCDLGHATLLHVIEKDRRFYGTPGYAAPEVTHGPMWSPAADVWSMGVVMYALLSNTLPFEAEDGWRSPADLSSKAWWKVRRFHACTYPSGPPPVRDGPVPVPTGAATMCPRQPW